MTKERKEARLEIIIALAKEIGDLKILSLAEDKLKSLAKEGTPVLDEETPFSDEEIPASVSSVEEVKEDTPSETSIEEDTKESETEEAPAVEITEEVADAAPSEPSLKADSSFFFEKEHSEKKERKNSIFKGLSSFGNMDDFDKLVSGSVSETSPKEEGAKEETVTSEVIDVKEITENPFAFGRSSISKKPTERALYEAPKEIVPTVTPKAYIAPFGDGFPNTEHMKIKDCIFSMFMGEICTKTSPLTEDIYFMIAPFTIAEDSISTEILFYIYYNGLGYVYTSLNNKENRSCYVEIPATGGGTFSFIARGKWEAGKWSSSVLLGVSSEKKEDYFKIKGSLHNNPEEIPENPHPRFHYEGYINRPDLVSVGNVDVFPVDGSGENYIVVRCVEDFIDYIDTSMTKEVEIKRSDKTEIMTVNTEDGEINLSFVPKDERAS